MIELLTTKYTYLVVVALLAIGAYVMIESDNFVKKIIGLNIFQTGIFVFFISAAFRTGGRSPVVQSGGGGGPFVSPLPHVLILTAIVVGVSLTAVALGLVVRIYESYGTINEDTLEEVLANE
ncbi:sodium:proton antiporter [Haloplanus aerogenes]|uniref:Cation:proton antiporter n=1 Tax=Haloplanus aerogenes TaxID=660522 RepID=A0A3M0DTJ1_9EURY|nr:cation:proton antiporter subunit C [Haloplanus aerogenes]AZH25556.1 cation:proton antiporter [Haloplanus aerogenes]RMB25272.1 multicomponent Na+:H+ antiporter subunit C [Haloplanus aerogenes]